MTTATRTMEKVCAWCTRVIVRKQVPEAALPTGVLPSGTLRTHGICGECAEFLDPIAASDGTVGEVR